VKRKRRRRRSSDVRFSEIVPRKGTGGEGEKGKEERNEKFDSFLKNLTFFRVNHRRALQVTKVHFLSISN
jgi:hypothetical protein